VRSLWSGVGLFGKLCLRIFSSATAGTNEGGARWGWKEQGLATCRLADNEWPGDVNSGDVLLYGTGCYAGGLLKPPRATFMFTNTYRDRAIDSGVVWQAGHGRW
jgi:hypothetical protein